MFQKRLMMPHANWDVTFSAFSTFVTEHFPQDYEQIMATTNQKAQLPKKQWSERENMETRLQAAQHANDKNAEFVAFDEYIRSEQAPAKGQRRTTTLST